MRKKRAAPEFIAPCGVCSMRSNLMRWIRVRSCPVCGTQIEVTQEHPYAIDVLEQRAAQLEGFRLRLRGKQREALAVHLGELNDAIRALGRRGA